jgi:hypothetical protein
MSAKGSLRSAKGSLGPTRSADLQSPRDSLEITQDALIAALDVKIAMLEHQLRNQEQTIAILQRVMRETMLKLRARNGSGAIKSLKRGIDP